jgi:hypothetical protein
MKTRVQPKSAIQLHHGVPGLAQYLWTAELLPMKQLLEAKGCELRLTTVLRDGSDRLMSEFNYMKEAGYDVGKQFHECPSPTKPAMLTDNCVCEYAESNGNMQTTDVNFGHLDEDSVFAIPTGAVSTVRQGTHCHSGCQAHPLRYLANGEETTNAEWADKTIGFIEATSYLVGCTENLETFGAALSAMMGLDPSEMPRERHSNMTFILNTTVRTSCIDKANVADNRLHQHFCGV